jgi:hypothetical protein
MANQGIGRSLRRLMPRMMVMSVWTDPGNVMDWFRSCNLLVDHL